MLPFQIHLLLQQKDLVLEHLYLLVQLLFTLHKLLLYFFNQDVLLICFNLLASLQHVKLLLLLLHHHLVHQPGEILGSGPVNAVELFSPLGEIGRTHDFLMPQCTLGRNRLTDCGGDIVASVFF